MDSQLIAGDAKGGAACADGVRPAAAPVRLARGLRRLLTGEKSNAAEILEPLWLDDFDPVAVRILDECDIAHLALIGPLDERHTVLVEPADRRVQIGHREANVAKALRLRVAVVVLECRVALRAPVVRELEDRALAEGPCGALADVVRRGRVGI